MDPSGGMHMWAENVQYMHHCDDDKMNSGYGDHHHDNHGCANNCVNNCVSNCKSNFIYQSNTGCQHGKKSERCAHSMAMKQDNMWMVECHAFWMIGQICEFCQSPLLFATQWQDY